MKEDFIKSFKYSLVENTKKKDTTIGYKALNSFLFKFMLSSRKYRLYTEDYFEHIFLKAILPFIFLPGIVLSLSFLSIAHKISSSEISQVFQILALLVVFALVLVYPFILIGSFLYFAVTGYYTKEPYHLVSFNDYKDSLFCKELKDLTAKSKDSKNKEKPSYQKILENISCEAYESIFENKFDRIKKQSAFAAKERLNSNG